jgi:uncharacterized protein
MVIGFGTITLRMPECHSLKEKRKVIKSIISRSQNNFNASIAEVGLNEVHQQGVLGFAFVGNDRQAINSKIDIFFEFVEGLHLADVTETSFEIMNI